MNPITEDPGKFGCFEQSCLYLPGFSNVVICNANYTLFAGGEIAHGSALELFKVLCPPPPPSFICFPPPPVKCRKVVFQHHTAKFCFRVNAQV